MIVCINLLMNAIKYSKGGTVRLRALRLPPGAELPTGLEAPRVEHAAENRDEAGDRLYVEELIMLMRGVIGCTSAPGVGSAFYFVVPIAPTSAAASASAEHARPAACSAPAVEAEASSSAAPLSEAPEGPSGSAAARSPHVLLVEDNPFNREVARLMLTKNGCEVETAEDGRQAVDAFAARQAAGGPPYDCILMDCEMPVLDG
eukprot:tig00021070_g17887.t1